VLSAGWWGERARWGAAGRFDRRAAAMFMRWVAPGLRWVFRPRVAGVEHLPRAGGFLVVANHSGGAGMAEIACLVMMKRDHFDDIPIAAMAHPVSFHLWPLTAVMRWVGAIPSTRRAAAGVLGDGIGVLVFPGGDHEAARPLWEAGRVDFGGRQGFLRLAQAAGVPVVPLGIAGSHLSVPILWRSRVLPWLLVLPRVFGIKRYPLTLTGVLGVVACLAWVPGWMAWVAAWLWMVSVLPLLPVVPVRIGYHFGAPMGADELFAGGMDAAYARVVGRVQALVDAA